MPFSFIVQYVVFGKILKISVFTFQPYHFCQFVCFRSLFSGAQLVDGADVVVVPAHAADWKHDVIDAMSAEHCVLVHGFVVGQGATVVLELLEWGYVRHIQPPLPHVIAVMIPAFMLEFLVVGPATYESGHQ